MISIGSIPIGTVRTIQNAGSPVGTGTITTLNYSAGATTGPAGTVNVAAQAGPTGPTGPTGPSGGPGPTGSQGPPGPPGPGFNNFSSSSTTGTIPGGSGTFTVNFGVGFNWRMAAGAATQITEAAFADGIGLSSVSGFNSTTVSVNVSYANNSAPSASYQVGYSASG